MEIYLLDRKIWIGFMKSFATKKKTKKTISQLLLNELKFDRKKKKVQRKWVTEKASFFFFSSKFYIKKRKQETVF